MKLFTTILALTLLFTPALAQTAPPTNQGQTQSIPKTAPAYLTGLFNFSLTNSVGATLTGTIDFNAPEETATLTLAPKNVTGTAPLRVISENTGVIFIGEDIRLYYKVQDTNNLKIQMVVITGEMAFGTAQRVITSN